MSDKRPNQKTPDAAKQREQPEPKPRRSEPWTGQGPIIRNLPTSSRPYGDSPERRPEPAGPMMSPWIVVAIIAFLAVIIAAIVLIVVL